MANNFRIEVTDSNFSVVDGTLEDFVGGDGYVQLKALSDPTYPTFNLYIDNSNINFSMVKTIKFKRTIVSLNQNPSYNSNYGYYDSNNTWHYIAQNPSSVGGIMTFNNLSIPSDATKFQFGCNSYLLTTNGEYKLEEFDVFDANGNSLLKSSEPSKPSTGLPLYIGDSNIQAVKLGNIDIFKMYIGDTLIYGN